MGSQMFNSSDLDSPGYEYLRSYQAMANLHHKLLALDYQKEFCPLYKCPPINRYYFAQPSSNQVEQQFSFVSLCVWLIKDKCQMNFDTDPGDYQDLDATIDVIFEALRLLLGSDELPAHDQRHLFPPGRLKQGYGPEVIFCLNKLADRALELALEERPRLGQVEIFYHNKHKGAPNRAEQTRTSGNAIIIGQPIVGGGLTTRPLGNYQIDDSSLIFDLDGLEAPDDERAEQAGEAASTQAEWSQEKLDKIAPLFEIDYNGLNSTLLSSPAVGMGSWPELLEATREARREVEAFIGQSKPALESVCRRAERQLQILTSREASLNANMKGQVGSFLFKWREHCKEVEQNSELNEKVNHKADLFESYVEQLKNLRTKEVKLNDESQLEELQRLTARLSRQAQSMDLKLGLLLAAACQTGAQ